MWLKALIMKTHLYLKRTERELNVLSILLISLLTVLLIDQLCYELVHSGVCERQALSVQFFFQYGARF